MFYEGQPYKGHGLFFHKIKGVVIDLNKLRDTITTHAYPDTGHCDPLALAKTQTPKGAKVSDTFSQSSYNEKKMSLTLRDTFKRDKSSLNFLKKIRDLTIIPHKLYCVLVY